MEYFPCYHSYAKRCERLTDEELGQLFRALITYSSTGERAELEGMVAIAFDFIADDIDKAQASYEAKCRAQRENGLKGGRPKTQKIDGFSGLSDDTQKSDGFSEKPKKPNEPKEKKIKEKEKEIITTNVVIESKRFAPPARCDVEAYCAEKGYAVDIEKWFAHYEANGWKVGKNQMKDWRASIRYWAADSKPQAASKSFAEMWREMA